MSVACRWLSVPLVVVAVAVVAGVGCGGAANTGIEPATAPTVTAPLDDCGLAALPVVERPPGQQGISPTEEFERIGWAIDRYGKRFPEQFAGARAFVRDGAPAFGVGFTGDLDLHRAALRDLLSDPDAIVLCQTKLAQRDLDRILRGLPTDGSVRGGGSDTWDRVTVHLRADQRALADDLLMRHGPVVRTQLGTQPYPVGSWALPGKAACPTLPDEATSGMVAEITLNETTVRAGADFKADLTIRNRGSAEASVTHGVNHLVVLRPGTREVVAVYEGPYIEPALGPQVPPGGVSRPFTMTGGTASCEPGESPALAPGDYDVIAAIPVDVASPIGSASGPVLPFERARLTVVP